MKSEFISEYLHFYMQRKKHYALNLPHPSPHYKQHQHSIERFPMTSHSSSSYDFCVSLGELPSFWAKYNCCIEWGVYFVICTVFYVLQVWRKAATNACVPCTILISNGKRISMNWAARVCFHIVPPEQYRDCQTVAPLSHSSLVPRPLPFLPSVCIHNNTWKWSSTPVNANGSQKWGRPGNELYIPLICALLFLYSLSPIHGRHLSFGGVVLLWCNTKKHVVGSCHN